MTVQASTILWERLQPRQAMVAVEAAHAATRNRA
jgi:hypothetical protein